MMEKHCLEDRNLNPGFNPDIQAGVMHNMHTPVLYLGESMTTSDWANVAYCYIFTFGAVCTGIWWLFKHGVDKVIDNHLASLKDDIREELSVLTEMDKRTSRIEYALYNDGKTGLINKVDHLIEHQQLIRTEIEVMKVKTEII